MGKRMREKLGAKAMVQRHRGEAAEEPTREGGRSVPVERKGSGAATLPQALQSGIVYCPSTPQGSRQEGEAPGKERTPPVAQRTGEHEIH